MGVVAVRPVIARRVDDAIAAADDEAVARPVEALHRFLRLRVEVRHGAHSHLPMQLVFQAAHGGPRRVADASEAQVVVGEFELVVALGGGAGGERKGQAGHEESQPRMFRVRLMPVNGSSSGLLLRRGRCVALAALLLRHVPEDLLDVSATTHPTGLSTLRTLNLCAHD